MNQSLNQYIKLIIILKKSVNTLKIERLLSLVMCKGGFSCLKTKEYNIVSEAKI